MHIHEEHHTSVDFIILGGGGGGRYTNENEYNCMVTLKSEIRLILKAFDI